MIEKAEQFRSLAIGQADQCLRVSDPALGQDPAGLDRADSATPARCRAPSPSSRTKAAGRGSAPTGSCRRRGPSSASLSPTGPRSHAATQQGADPAIDPERSRLPRRLTGRDSRSRTNRAARSGSPGARVISVDRTCLTRRWFLRIRRTVAVPPEGDICAQDRSLGSWRACADHHRLRGYY